jgi:NAD(P)-dependent dehydrogenase (short-subunit alcohol dehydrogenase family)
MLLEVQGDVAKLGDLDRLFEQIKRDKDKLDIVFANAGIAKNASLGARRRAFRHHLRRQCEGSSLYTVQTALSVARRRIYHPQRVASRQQRTAGKQRLFGD